MPSRIYVQVGARFGRLVVIGVEGPHCYTQKIHCDCDCGGQLTTLRRLLTKPTGTRSCGCLRLERSGLAAKLACTTHGKSKSREYKIWAKMVERGTDSNSLDSATRYYARGITVCLEWVGPGGFERFIAYIGNSPTLLHSIDRIDNSQGYRPGNVRWATSKEQARNRRSNRNITAFGRCQSLAAWGEETGIKAPTISNRLALGWHPEDAVSLPLQMGGRKRKVLP